MDQALETFLETLHRSGSEHDVRHEDRLQRLRNLEPESARMLAVLVRALGAQRIIELGTSNGYSTIWLADAARQTGGRVVSVDFDATRIGEALRNVTDAGLAELVELHTGDAGEHLRASEAASADVIFLDAERPQYAGYWPELVRVLRPGGLLAVDNVISHAEEVAELRGLVAADPRVMDALVPIGEGILLVVRET
ncbi:MAG TPA: O-methyltransferase [Solirubrobacteraceae bacterium]|jgi:predicted O-methyltransferase YrrM|nr:O-methyltransferase [Solirubrobacteraceae bacterium]